MGFPFGAVSSNSASPFFLMGSSPGTMIIVGLGVEMCTIEHSLTSLLQVSLSLKRSLVVLVLRVAIPENWAENCKSGSLLSVISGQ